MLVILLSAACVSSSSLPASEAGIPRISILTPHALFAPVEEGLKLGLREHGYVHGQTASVEWRRSRGTIKDLRILAAELVAAKSDVIVTFGTPATRAALETTTTVPVVFLVGDPVLLGFASSLARPGGNATGVSVVDTELSAKRMELLRLCIPAATRVLYLMNSSNPLAAAMLKETEEAAHTLNVTLVKLDVTSADGLELALQAIARSRADAILASPDPLFLARIDKVKAAVRKAALPGMFPFREYLGNGALMSYGPNLKDASRRAAKYVSAVLGGARPGDLPIEQISTYELVVDLKAARAMGITVPPDVLLRADEVIR